MAHLALTVLNLTNTSFTGLSAVFSGFFIDEFGFRSPFYAGIALLSQQVWSDRKCPSCKGRFRHFPAGDVFSVNRTKTIRL